MCGIVGANGTDFSQNSKKINLFKKSFKNLQNKDALRDELLFLKVRTICENSGEIPVSASGDPILHYILGYSERPSNEAILDYYRRGANSLADYVDLFEICLFLGEGEYARKLVDVERLEPGLLPMDASDDVDLAKSDIDFSSKWFDLLRIRKECTKEKAEEAEGLIERRGFLHRFRFRHKVITLCEMAARGYSWDAFILMYLLYPDNEVTNSFGSFIWESLDLGWVKEINCLSAKQANFARLTNLGLNSNECYTTLKTSFAINKDSLYARSSIYSGVRLCLLTSACEADNVVSAREMMKNFLGSSDDLFIQECLPALQRFYFEKAFTVMHDFIHLVLHLSGVMTNNVFASYEDDSIGILNNLMNKWIDEKVLPLDKPFVEAQRGISDVIYTFIGDVLNSSKLMLKCVDYKVYIIAALRFAEVLFTNNSTRSSTFIIYDIVCEINNGDQLVNKLLESIDCKMQRFPSSITNMTRSISNCLLTVKYMLPAQTPPQNMNTAQHQHDSFEVESASKDDTVAANDNDSLLLEPHTSKGEIIHGSSFDCISSIDKDLETLQDENIEQPVMPIDSKVVPKVTDNNIACALQTKLENPEDIVSRGDLKVQQAIIICEQPAANSSQEESNDVTELDRMLQIGFTGNTSCFAPAETFGEELKTGSNPHNNDGLPQIEVNHTVIKTVRDSIDASPFVYLTPANTNSVSHASEKFTEHVSENVPAATPVAHSETTNNPHVSMYSAKYEGSNQSKWERNVVDDKKSRKSFVSGDNKGHINSWRNKDSCDGSADHRDSHCNTENFNGGRGIGNRNSGRGGSGDFAGHIERGSKESGGYKRNDNQNNSNGGGRAGYRGRGERRGQSASNN